MCIGEPWTEEQIEEHDANITPGEILLGVWDGTESTLYNLFIKWGKELPYSSTYTIESTTFGTPSRDDEYIPAQISNEDEWSIQLEPGDRIVRDENMELRIDRD